MTIHFYFSLVPEALIASMLDPEEFGFYYAVGTSKKTRGQAMFFEVDPAYRNPYFRIDEALARCIPDEDGTPKTSVYISIYRVLEHIDLDMLMSLYLTTQDGRTLELKPSPDMPNHEKGLHLYQEIAPVSPLVVSVLSPIEFYELIVRDPSSLVTVPAITFAELDLGELADDPEMGLMDNLPYSNSDHLRECLSQVQTKYISTKMVDRAFVPKLQYRTVKNGFFVGNGKQLKYYPMPSQTELRAENYRWFRSANM